MSWVNVQGGEVVTSEEKGHYSAPIRQMLWPECLTHDAPAIAVGEGFPNAETIENYTGWWDCYWRLGAVARRMDRSLIYEFSSDFDSDLAATPWRHHYDPDEDLMPCLFR